MTFKTSSEHITLATSLALEFAETAIIRDSQGGTPKKERDRLRESGLLKLIIPEKYGGIGENWIAMLRVTRELAKVDSSLAHVFSYHHIGVVIPHIFGTQSQQEYYYTKTVENNWFWCNALNPRDTTTILTQKKDCFFINGKKSFCSGSVDSDILPLSAINETTKEVIVLIIPSQRKGVTINSDWDNMGQRQTDSGTIDFDHVIVYPHEIIGARYNQKSNFINIRSCITQLNLANIYLGIAEGAFLAAKNYTQHYKKPWDANVSVAEDPYILQHYGNMYVDLQAANLLIEKAANLLQESWQQEHNLTLEKRGECMLAVNNAKIMAQRVGLDITNRIFEVMGASSTNNKYGFDRYWRNMRTFTLHDPIDYRIKEVGKWALNDQFPHTRAY
ncbi:acyl-CoA dehydrogenase family protein [Anabaena sp. FACHB-1237]|uniref:acyl-CoA dehydrogenase family protein n=1 Tax=Anabaena sp. FACHB-1237 TaxID=2692769 RepID=UPI0016814F23|nr:acyl-CoA dehydrogenase family protein [Anabaena sp. FACHB-1237]MBD2137875.1 acyl-CoA dehydrogenase family protein [Anabaena sp. FACHB-1237]